LTENAPSLAGRAALALLLMIGFYVLAVGLAVGLIALPILEYQSLHRVHVKVALGCVIGAGLIAWSVLPRWDKFPAPGVLLDAKKQPELFAVIEGVARATGQAMPVEVYLVPDVNAFVAQRGGVMGFFSRRVLGIGLPLLRVFDVDQIRAVLAHEFGHFHGGDTMLGPWIHKTRSALMRTVRSLASAESWLTYPFRWYGMMFLKITHGISRAQEYAADRLAARVVGAQPLASGLEALPATAALYGLYLDREVGPVLGAGRRPPLGAGFRLFLGSDKIRAAAAAIGEQALQQQEVDPYDTHPPTPRRIAALAGLPARGPGATDTRPAIELLRDRDPLERDLLVFMTGKRKVGDLPAIEWREIGEQIVLQQWKEHVVRWRDVAASPLIGMTLGDLPRHVSRAAEIGKAHADSRVPPEQHAAFGAFVLATSAGVALHGTGFVADSQPGDPVVLERDGHRFAVVEDVQQLIDGSLTADAWRARCQAAGVDGLALTAV